MGLEPPGSDDLGGTTGSRDPRRADMVTSPQGLNVCGMYNTASFSLRGILLPVFSKACTGACPVDALKAQSSNSNTKVSRVPVHLQSEGPTRGLGVRLTCRSMHFRFSEYQKITRFNSAITDADFTMAICIERGGVCDVRQGVAYNARVCN